MPFSFTMPHWERLSSETLIRNRYIHVQRDTCRLPDGVEIDDYFVLREPDVACVFAVTDDGRIVLVEQYKHGLGRACLEIPGGQFSPTDDDAIAAARRELREETGYEAPPEAFHLLGVLPVSPARTNIRVHLVGVTGCALSSQPYLDPLERIAVHVLPPEEVRGLMRDGTIDVISTLTGLFMGFDWWRGVGQAGPTTG